MCYILMAKNDQHLDRERCCTCGDYVVPIYVVVTIGGEPTDCEVCEARKCNTDTSTCRVTAID